MQVYFKSIKSRTKRILLAEIIRLKTLVRVQLTLDLQNGCILLGKCSSEATKEEGEREGAIKYKIAAAGNNNIITTTLFKLQQNYNSTTHRCLYPIASKLYFTACNFTKTHAPYLRTFLRSLQTNFTIQLISKYTICRLHFTFQYYIFHFIVGYCQ